MSPQGAGDLIDRAVRLYRRHFMTLIRTAAPPVCVSTLGAVLWTIGLRASWATMSGAWLAVYVLMMMTGVVLIIGGYLLYLIVMGGASRNLVAHLLYDEQVSARTIYRNVRARFWGLVVASIIVACALSVASGIAFMVFYIGLIAVILIGLGASQFGAYWLTSIIAGLVMLVVTFAALWVFFFLAARVAYVPQVMLVEGRSPFAALARSASLASGSTWRLMAMFSFTTFATYSALAALLIPLAWYGYLNGVEPWVWSATEWPLWYSVGNQVVWNVSSILLAPVWMLGLSLLYVDERVRREGYDIELHAARVFGDEPLIPQGTYKGALSPDATQTNGANASHFKNTNALMHNSLTIYDRATDDRATTYHNTATAVAATPTSTSVEEIATGDKTASLPNDPTANEPIATDPASNNSQAANESVDANVSRVNPLLLACLSAVLFALVFAPRVSAATVEDYGKRVRAGHVAIESLIAAEGDEAQTSEDYMRLEVRTFDNLRRLLPARETIEWNDTKLEIDNMWLHEWMKQHADEKFEDHATDLHNASVRLLAIQERISEATGGALTSASTKDADKGRLAAILSGAEYDKRAAEESAIKRLWQRIVEWLESWFPDYEPSKSNPSRQAKISTVAQVLVILLALVVIGLVVWRFIVSYRKRKVDKSASKRKEARVVLGEEIAADKGAPDLLAEAEALFRAGDGRAGVRKIYIAALCELADRKLLRLSKHYTNRDYLHAVRSLEPLHQGMQQMTSSFERHWYGTEQAYENEWQNFRRLYEQTLNAATNSARMS